MQNIKTIQSLVDLGLDANEAKIYLYLIKVGSNKKENTAFSIGNNLSLPRSTVYLYLERLIKLELVSVYKINNKKHFLGENLKGFEKKLDKQKEILNNVLIDIKALAEQHSTDFATRVYRGTGSLEKVYEEIFDAVEMTKYQELYILTNPLLTKLLPKKLPAELDRIKKINNIYTKMLLVKNNNELESVFRTDSHREVRTLPDGSIFDGSIYIYGDKMALFSLDQEDPLSMIIESKTIVQMVKSFFLCTWGLIGNSK